MSAGLATLKVIEEDNVYARLEESAGFFERSLRELINLQSFNASLIRIGSIFWISLGGTKPPLNPSQISSNAADRYRQLFHFALCRGIYLAPSAYEVGFISTAHDEVALTKAAEVLAEGIANCETI